MTTKLEMLEQEWKVASDAAAYVYAEWGDWIVADFIVNAAYAKWQEELEKIQRT